MENIENLSLEEKFELFWKMYPKKVWKRPVYIKFKYIKDWKNLFDWLEKYVEKWKIEKTPKTYIPDPRTWINQERYYDEIIIDEKKAPKYEKIMKDKIYQQNERKKYFDAQLKKKDIISTFNLLPLEEREKIKIKADEEIKKISPKTYEKKWLFYEQLLKSIIIKIVNSNYFKNE